MRNTKSRKICPARVSKRYEGIYLAKALAVALERAPRQVNICMSKNRKLPIP